VVVQWWYSGSTVVEHSLHHDKVKASRPATTAGTMREKIVKKVLKVCSHQW